MSEFNKFGEAAANWKPLRRSMDVGPQGSLLPTERSAKAAANNGTEDTNGQQAANGASSEAQPKTPFMESGQRGAGLEKILINAQAVRAVRGR